MTMQTSAGDITLNKFSCRIQADEFQSTVARTHNSRLKEIKKRRALRGKQRVELLINSAGKRTVVLLNPSFFYFFNPFFVSGNTHMEINSTYWIGDKLDYGKWKRFTLFHKAKNQNGGSISTPIARLELIESPGQDGINPHVEVKLIFRNVVEKAGNTMTVNPNYNGFKSISQIIEDQELDKIHKFLLANSLIWEPYSFSHSIESEQHFVTAGEFFTNE